MNLQNPFVVTIGAVEHGALDYHTFLYDNYLDAARFYNACVDDPIVVCASLDDRDGRLLVEFNRELAEHQV
jgi:hypothetical protein